MSESNPRRKYEAILVPARFSEPQIQKELDAREDSIIGAEARIAASLEQVRGEVFRLGRAQQALFAFVDSLAKVV